MDLYDVRSADVGDRGHRDARNAPAVPQLVLAAYLVSTFQPGISAKQLQRQLAIGCHETAWAMLHKLGGAMVAPERELLKGEVEIDEFFLGGYEEGLSGGRQRGKKTLCGAAIEVRGHSSARLRVAVLADASGPELLALYAGHNPGRRDRPHRRATVLPDAGRTSLRPPSAAQTSAAAGEQLLPRAHRAISNLKAWMHGTHRGVSPEHVPATTRTAR